ncbi:magnesium transporter [Photobacterium sp. 2_MG-2023]|uniref:magnesium transporter n=1 Tax=Photobacterium sp. 2_MG-2023 TaxID=3062663 RepID=UPI0026E286AA|nr:magnesium transporter [Photobacterium sp. 2_MG-2023]MDO6581557.1 magnesium transporter [Photobacterium sp. 2_MG-2023]
MNEEQDKAAVKDLLPQQELSQWVEDLNRVHDEEQERVFSEASEVLETSELGLLLESLPLDERLALWQTVAPEERVEVLVAMRSDARGVLIDNLSMPDLRAMLHGLDAEDLIELSQSLSDKLVDFALAKMSQDQKSWYEQSQQYDEEQIGRYVDHSLVMLTPNTRVFEALRAVRRADHPMLDRVYVVDKKGLYKGEVSLPVLLAADGQARVDSLEDDIASPLKAEMDVYDASERLEHSDQAAMAVVDESGRFVGRATLRLAMEITRETYEARLMARAGLNEDTDLFAPVWLSAKRRALWLGINLLTAFLASWTIGLFEATLSQVVALAVLMPVVASMGGIAGSQTLTLIIRGLAMGQITFGNVWSLAKKELLVACLNGVLWAVVIAIVAAVWFSSVGIGGVIAAAITINIVVAAIAGVVIPVILDKYEIDPALSGSVILTTVTDVVGFFTFLGLGSLFLLG